MYIEFNLANLSLQGYNSLIQAIDQWSVRYQVTHRTKTVKYFVRITFDKDTDYTLFSMTWNPGSELADLVKWRIVSDLNNKTTFDFPV